MGASVRPAVSSKSLRVPHQLNIDCGLKLEIEFGHDLSLFNIIGYIPCTVNVSTVSYIWGSLCMSV